MKKFRNLVTIMCLMLCTIVLVSCGGDPVNPQDQLEVEASVSKTGYVTATKTDLDTFNTENPNVTVDQLKSFRYTEKYKGTISGFTMESAMNCIVTVDENNNIEGVALEIYYGGVIAIAYYKDGNQYVSIFRGGKISRYTSAIDLTLDVNYYSVAKAVSWVKSVIDDIPKSFASLEDLVGDADTTFEKAVEDEDTKFHIETTMDGGATCDAYFELNGANIIGFEVFSYSGNEKRTSAMCAFDGKIEYPSFEGYESVDIKTISDSDDLEAIFDFHFELFSQGN